MERDEAHRQKWALGLSITLSAFILIGFGFYKGFLSIDTTATLTRQASSKQTAAVVSSEKVPSPLDSSKKTFEAAFSEINKQYRQFVETVSAVFVPFVTGIDVYERK